MEKLIHRKGIEGVFSLKGDQEALIIAKNTPNERDFTFYGKHISSGFEESTQKHYIQLTDVFLTHEALDFDPQGNWRSQMDAIQCRNDKRRRNFCWRFFYYEGTLDVYAVAKTD